DVTVALKIAFAKYEGGSILSFISGVSVNGEALTLTDGQVAPGTAENQWWNVSNVQVATINLKAGEIYTFQIGVNSGNLDGYVLDVVADEPVTPPAHECESVCPECGKCLDAECTEDACVEKCEGHEVVINPDITVPSTGSVKLEMETFNLSNCTIVLRGDLINAGYTAPGNSEGRIWGLGNGTTFRVYVKVDEACTLKIYLSGFGTAMSNYTYKFGETSLNAAGNYGSGAVAEGLIGTVEVAEAGVYLFEFTSGQNTDLDYLRFEVVEEAPAHECESVCPECGKCLDAECAEDACAEKCEGHQVVVTPDITITDASDSYKAEAEALDMSTLVPQTGFEKPAVETFNGGQGLGGIAGGYQTFIVTTEKDVTVALKIAFAKYEGGSILSFISGVSVNGEALTLTDGQVAPGTAENQWWNVSNVQVATINLKAGEIYTFQVGVNCGNLDGYVLEVVEIVPAHECESICTACGKCTDAECAEAACESKCAGHAIDATISTDDVAVTLEGESWNYADDTIVTRSDFIPSIGAGNLKNEPGNGATCIFAFTAGTKFVLNIEAVSDMTVDLLLRGATDAAGYDVASKLAVTVNGKSVSGGYGSLTGSGDKPYWDWQTVCLGKIDLVKGVNEITITVLDGHPNIDWVRLVPVDADITVATSGSTTLHMENFEEHKSTIDSKDDFVNAYASQGFKEGDVFKNAGLGRIYGFNASTFVMHVEVKEACTLKISVNLWNCNALNTYKYYFNGQAINCTNETAPTGAGVYEIGSVTVSEAGIYTFIFTTGGVDFDEVIFTVVE
ncbi:MAG: hypothetical protein IJX58_02970, partial [Clostridia bacterium]|nr:hypothetical protein [Clostridia bacterium]